MAEAVRIFSEYFSALETMLGEDLDKLVRKIARSTRNIWNSPSVTEREQSISISEILPAWESPSRRALTKREMAINALI